MESRCAGVQFVVRPPVGVPPNAAGVESEREHFPGPKRGGLRRLRHHKTPSLIPIPIIFSEELINYGRHCSS